MCIIALINNKTTVTKKDLEAQWDKNPDGAGVCYVKDNKLEIIKGLMNFSHFMRVFESINTSLPFAYHFRYATHGKIDQRSTHPFLINTKAIFHNGVMYKLGNNKDSDTIELCNNILKHVPFKYWEKILDDIDSSRFLVMYLNTRNRLKIFKTGNWIKHKNNLYSNMNWLDLSFYRSTQKNSTKPNTMLWKGDYIDVGYYEED